LSVDAKVALVQQVRDEVPLGAALRAVSLARSTWHYRVRHWQLYEARYRALRAPLERIARTHPEYGYRRTTTELQEAHGLTVNQKVVRRLHRLWELPLVRGTRPPRPSAVRQAIAAAGPQANLVAGLGALPVRAVLYTDFTELVYARGKAWLMTFVDHASKVVPGWALGPQADTALALRAWRRARRWLRRHGFPVAGVVVHHDRDPVYTGYGWTAQLLLTDHVRLSYALNGCRDNPEMEAFHSRFKTENRSLFLDALTLADLERVVAQRLRYYNGRRRHSSLGNQAPLSYLAGLSPAR
jgi:putative transposase